MKLNDNEIYILRNALEAEKSKVTELKRGYKGLKNGYKDIIDKQKLYALYKGGKKHVVVEGWTTLGALSKVFAHVEYTKRIDMVLHEHRDKLFLAEKERHAKALKDQACMAQYAPEDKEQASAECPMSKHALKEEEMGE